MYSTWTQTTTWRRWGGLDGGRQRQGRMGDMCNGVNNEKTTLEIKQKHFTLLSA